MFEEDLVALLRYELSTMWMVPNTQMGIGFSQSLSMPRSASLDTEIFCV
jgi:hypothetical protein